MLNVAFNFRINSVFCAVCFAVSTKAVLQPVAAAGVPATLFFNADGTLSSAHFGEVSKAILQQGIAGAYQ